MQTAVSPYVIPGLYQPEPEPEPEPKTKTDEERLIKAIADEFKILPEDFMKHIAPKSRKREVVIPRQLIQSMMKFVTNLSLSEIGLKFGCKNHATVLHSCRTTYNLYQTDKYYRAMVDRIIDKAMVQKIRCEFEGKKLVIPR